MGILNSCCCCCRLSVRRGSFVSAFYTIVYFFAFALLTGNMAYIEVQNWMEEGSGGQSSSGPGPGHQHHHQHHGTVNNNGTTGNTFAAAAGTGIGIGTGTGSGFGTTTTPVPQGLVVNSQPNLQDNQSSPLGVHKTTTASSPTQPPPFSVVILLVDFACEVSGFFASIVLIQGLQQERKSFLIPWMVIVPAHTAIDVYTACEIVIAFLSHPQTVHGGNGGSGGSGTGHGQAPSFPTATVTATTITVPDSQPGQDSYGTLLLFGTVSLTSIINIYVLLCVISQYQEYCAGRGTAAFESLLRRNGGSVRGERGSSFRRSRPTQKSDIWCDDLIFSKSNNASGRRQSNRGDIQMSGLENSGKNNAKGTESDRVPTVRFENEMSSGTSMDCGGGGGGGGRGGDARQRLISHKMPFSSSHPCPSLTVPSNRSSTHRNNCNYSPNVTVMEEQSTTADSIDEM